MVKCIYCDQPAEMRVIGHGWIPTPKHHLPLCRKHCIEAEEGGYDKQKAAWDEYHRQRSETKVLAQYPPSASPAELLALFKKSYGEEAVIRTSPRWDKAVEHLGYSSVDSPPVAGVMTDEELVRDSQERLQKVTAVDAGTLSPQRRAVLQVSRALCQDFSPSISSIEAAQIPPASQRV
ncbi:MAG: hypothetical protein Q8R28_16320, partial [Dehalococcoidia bacterium]|nr:hypothetical protein [Dehalococcoidia bacterium]